MDALLKSFQAGFILRSLFAGVFFLVSYRFTHDGPSSLALDFSDKAIASGLAIATFVGVTGYVIHRALVYPVVEHILSLEAVDRVRRRWPLISETTLNDLGDLWAAGAESGRTSEAFARQIALWGDYTHMLYVSALCVILGSLHRSLTTPAQYDFSWKLAATVLVLFAAGLVSNWRLRSVRHTLLPKRAQIGEAK